MRDLAIRNTHATVVTIIGDTDARDENGDVVVLDESAITTEVTRLQAVYDSQAYARTRKAKYDLLNQDEMRYDDVKNSTTTWVDAIDAIKAAHPKPEA
jgi:hypothetical protein